MAFRDMEWKWKKFSELTPEELYLVLQLRQRVFVVEQNCPYLDCDDLDRHSFHLLGMREARLLAYARVLPKEIKYEEASIGRVVSAPEVRGQGAGRAVVRVALEKLDALEANA